MNIIIRRVTINDLDAITAVESECFPEAEAATRSSLEQRIKTFPDSFFVAEIDGKIIGFINGCVTNAMIIYDELFSDASLHIANGDYQAIFGLDVIPDYRNQGIAAQLMNHIIQTAKSAGRKGLILTCKDNLIQYYSKFGYINKGRSKSKHGGSVWYDMILEFHQIKNTHSNLMDGIIALPSFPLVFVTVDNNIMVAAAFHFYSFEPPCVMVGIKPEKYTHGLIIDKKEFAINIPIKEQLDKIQICGSISGKEEDKFEKAGLTRLKANKIDSHIIEECPVNLECKLVHKVDYPGSHDWFIGEIVEVHIDEHYTRDDALMFWLGQFRTVGNIIEGKHNNEIFVH